MKNYSNFIFLFCISLFWSCKSEQPSNKVKITVKATNSKGQAVAIKSMNMLSSESITLKESKLDSSGLAKLEFDLPNTQFVQIQIGEKTNPLLLSPSDDLDITLDFKNTDSKPIFKGKAAEASNYLNQSNLITQKFERSGGKYIFELDPAGYKKRSDSLSNAYLTLHKAFLDTTKIDKSICSLLEKGNKVSMLWRKQNYTFAMFREVEDTTKIPAFFRNIYAEIPLDSNLLKSNMGEYELVMRLLTVTKNNELYAKKSQQDAEIKRNTICVKNEADILKENCSQPVKELLLAKNFDYWVKALGVTPTTKRVYENFIKFSKSSQYSNTVQKIYTKFDSLSTGKPAPDIIGLSPTGDKVALSDFKDKMVFIDVWATWCGPCREELPKTRMIERKYKGNNQVVFMYVSVDNNTEAWRTLLKKDKSFSGIQINDPRDGKHKSIGEKYMIGGIPRYILIDQKGNIINSFAPKPSSGKVEALIDQQLGLL